MSLLVVNNAHYSVTAIHFGDLYFDPMQLQWWKFHRNQEGNIESVDIGFSGGTVVNVCRRDGSGLEFDRLLRYLMD